MPDSGLASETEGFFAAHDGLKLFYRRWDAARPRGICLLAHGLAEHSGRYRYLAETLARRGLSVWAPDHRGHGRSEGLRGDCSSLSDFVEDLRRLGAQARGQLPGLPLLLIGHSLGGLIVLTCAAQYPDEIRAVAASSPALKLTHETPPWTVALVTAISRIFPTAPFRNGINPEALCRDPAVVEAYRKDPLIHDILTARCAVALRQAMRRSFELAGKLKMPCLILQADQDAICSAEAAVEFHRRMNGSGATLRRYEQAYHELFNEPQKERVIEDLCAWIEGVLR